MEQVTSRDGTKIGFVQSGTGPALLLVHGTTADHSRWAPITPRLERHFKVYAMDRRGRGGSTDGPDYHILREAEDVAAVIAAIDEPVFLLGHSYGAVCSLEACLLTDKVSRLVLYEPPIPTGHAMYPTDTPDRMQALIDRGEGEAAVELMMREIVRLPAHEFETYRNSSVWKVRVSLAPTIPREIRMDRTYAFDAGRFGNWSLPTLLLLGGDSPPIFRRGIEVLSAALPGARVLVMPGQQHIAMESNPDLFLEGVLGFLLE